MWMRYGGGLAGIEIHLIKFYVGSAPNFKSLIQPCIIRFGLLHFVEIL